MKDSKFTVILALACAMMLAATSSMKVAADLEVHPRTEIVIESPQPNGMETKQVIVEVEDLVTSFKYKGQTFVNTNTYTPSNAIIKMVPSDTRRVR